MTINPGDVAPVFSLPDAQGNFVSLADFRGRRVVLYFYPRDNTPGCTKEACGFRDIYSDYESRNIAVLGVSTDGAGSHAKFAAKYQLPFPLLCDSNAEVATAYGCYGLKKFMGKEFMGITRSTFAIDPDGRIEKVYRKVKAETHAAEILADLPDLSPELKIKN
ncbi:thioredoxin-dependent thiol peroxidase [Microcoleus sp. S28C3]|uniref:thioredoxin-dependent peroxiredoxin n=2 Tax=Microcoleus TaxID=44471 RepID=A0ABX2CS78_9CYAN|nr:thioredoxin-dependent thiol peroxidase [Microcoleus asticus]NQE33214.1 putative peroxiredoxin bcp [Microcoleus asticus IPMA8]